MLRVWSDSRKAGHLGHAARGPGSSFAYDQEALPERAVSLAMPKRLASYEQDIGLHPIFEMNMPEGALRERLRLAFAKEAGRFDDLDVLAVTGRSQMGRIRYTAPDADLDQDVPFQSVDEILARRRDGSLLTHLMQRFAAYSGISGVQPKVLIRDQTDTPTPERSAIRGATHIVKFWDRHEYPHLAANEFFCMRAAERAGLDVPRIRLADDGAALVVDRFDLRPDGTYRGMEDFCVLNGKRASEKYDGGYERAVFRRLRDNITDPLALRADTERLFALFVLNCGIRNGDAHLKNFALVYDDVLGMPRLSPVYDLITTTVYLPGDRMALTLDGKPFWPDARRLTALGTQRCGLAPHAVSQTLERVADAMTGTMADIRYYATENADFRDTAARMEAAWTEGIRTSLRPTGRYTPSQTAT